MCDGCHTHRRQPLERRPDAAPEPTQKRVQLQLRPELLTMQPLSEDAHRLVRQAPVGTQLTLGGDLRRAWQDCTRAVPRKQASRAVKVKCSVGSDRLFSVAMLDIYGFSTVDRQLCCDIMQFHCRLRVA